ncbi:diguanylate cyclase/phosphodiesterase with PAS/PAC sensor(s) [Methylovorus glucosotrophus SIP3-4]|uniref:Diguanylate cyclase/phosphodiesterase with PAS/PAC sensor(S) n=2 Tax=Methylovorus glucosotrophus TaxID=266009 RepID=C6XCZ3_METGS|nr:diguanylate cyclase/phosphodiesterase with PAS/PAC sensor(s) [Methylovorus glucosotrophus SIP3-4]
MSGNGYRPSPEALLYSGKHSDLTLEIVEMLYASSTRSFVFAAIVASLLVYVQLDVVPLAVCLAWMTFFLIVYGLRKALVWVYKRTPVHAYPPGFWLNWFRALSGLCGIAWGLSGIFLFYPHDTAHQAFLTLALAGVCGGAVMAYATDKPTAYAFAGGLILLGLPRFFWGGNHFSMLMAVNLLLFILYVTIASFKLANRLRENIVLRIMAHESQEAINAMAQRQKLHIDHTPLAVIEWDVNFRVTSWNAAAEHIFGYPPSEAMGRHMSFIVPPDGQMMAQDIMSKLTHEAGGQHWQHDNVRRDGRVIHCEWFNTAIKNDQNRIIGFASLIQDETAYKKAQDEIERLAYFDALTNLPNRRLLMERLSQALNNSRSSHRIGGLMFIDLDNFKTLNDSRGHAFGDLLLKEVAARLLRAVRNHDTVARIGGDEFVLLLEDIGRDESAAIQTASQIAEKILADISLPFDLGNYKHQCSASIGICMFYRQGMHVEEVLKRADAAMYETKRAGRNNYRFFDESMLPVIDSRASLKNDLRFALSLGQFELYYQPQVDGELRTTGAEVLLRWHHPERGMVPPGEFIPLAEESGMIIPIGNWVLQQACMQLGKWSHHAKTSQLRLSVNVSAMQFGQADFVEQVRHALLESGCNEKLLVLELTESLVIQNIDDIVSKMQALKSIGVSLSMDDFGLGYSSLSLLLRLPLDSLKIDQSFVREIQDNAPKNDSAVIVQTIVAMGKNLGLDVIAEGIEEPYQQAFLEQVGCHAYQGYLYGRPSELSVFEHTL